MVYDAVEKLEMWDLMKISYGSYMFKGKWNGSLEIRTM